MDIKTNAKLIKHYLSVLKLRREDFIKNYRPTHWENLTPNEQKRIIEQKLLDRQEELLKARLEINKFLRIHRERKKAYQLAKSKPHLPSNTRFPSCTKENFAFLSDYHKNIHCRT